MASLLFSTYKQGENRVTSTFLAVLERLSLLNMNRILQALLEDGSFSLVTFENQVHGKDSVPDAKIGTGASVWIETKTARGSVSIQQIRRHLKNLANNEKLLLLTPDDAMPRIPDDERLVWSNFRTLASVIEETLTDSEQPPSDMEAFLLREFLSMMRQDGLLHSAESRVLVVAAKRAWPMYEHLGIYRCQPGRSFQPSAYIAFYTAGEIKSYVPKIESVIERIDMKGWKDIEEIDGHQKELVEELRERIEREGRRDEFHGSHKLMFLSEPDDEETVKLSRPVANDKKDKNGNPTPFTYGQGYVDLESLKKARRTSEL